MLSIYSYIMFFELTTLMMAIVNSVEVIIIILAKSFGKATTEYEKARIEARRELQQIRNQDTSVVGREKLEAIAETLGIDYTNKNDDELRIAIEAEINKSKNK